MSSHTEFLLEHIPAFAERISENPSAASSALQRLLMSHQTAFALKEGGNFPGLLRTALEILTEENITPPVKVALGFDAYCTRDADVREVEDAVFLAYAWGGDTASMIAASYQAAERGRLSHASFLLRCAGNRLLENGQVDTAFFQNAVLAIFAAIRLYELLECRDILMQLLEAGATAE